MSTASVLRDASKPKPVLKFQMPETPASKVPRRFLKASDAVLAKPERVRKPLLQKAKRTFIF